VQARNLLTSSDDDGFLPCYWAGYWAEMTVGMTVGMMEIQKAWVALVSISKKFANKFR
jgi:hypothetical protein